MAEPDGLAIYGVWCLLLGLCSQQKNPRKGWLTRDGKKSGEPLSASDMALKFRREESEIARTLNFIQHGSVGWIESFQTVDLSSVLDDSLDSHHQLTTRSPSTHLEGRKEGMERRKEIDGLEIPVSLNQKVFLDTWEEWKGYRVEIKHPLTLTAAKKQLSMLAGIGSARAVAALNYSMSNQWQGIFEPKNNSHGQRPDRAAGTTNEGIAAQYRGIGRLKKDGQ